MARAFANEDFFLSGQTVGADWVPGGGIGAGVVLRIPPFARSDFWDNVQSLDWLAGQTAVERLSNSPAFATPRLGNGSGIADRVCGLEEIVNLL